MYVRYKLKRSSVQYLVLFFLDFFLFFFTYASLSAHVSYGEGSQLLFGQYPKVVFATVIIWRVHIVTLSQSG